MIHRHSGSYRCVTPKGKVVYKNRPIHSQSEMKRNKGKSYAELKAMYSDITKYGDDDGDGVNNYNDCKPWDNKRQDSEIYLGEQDPSEMMYTQSAEPNKIFISNIEDEDIDKISETIGHEEIHHILDTEFDTHTSILLDDIYNFENNEYKVSASIPILREKANEIHKLDKEFFDWVNSRISPLTREEYESAMSFSDSFQRQRDRLVEGYNQLKREIQDD